MDNTLETFKMKEYMFWGTIWFISVLNCQTNFQRSKILRTSTKFFIEFSSFLKFFFISGYNKPPNIILHQENPWYYCRRSKIWSQNFAQKYDISRNILLKQLFCIQYAYLQDLWFIIKYFQWIFLAKINIFQDHTHFWVGRLYFSKI